MPGNGVEPINPYLSIIPGNLRLLMLRQAHIILGSITEKIKMAWKAQSFGNRF